MPVLFHSITEIRIVMPVLDGLPHGAPKASEGTMVLQSKSIAPGKATHSKKTKKAWCTGKRQATWKLSALLLFCAWEKGKHFFPSSLSSVFIHWIKNY